ncbi:type III pantothenate kinase [Lysobacter sp. F6437]|uniref:type III pantothenate kinase n=1 Tax=Lysobacter sp. F6437 TaxID=3459296 RepID=UPI00403D7189
MNHWVFDLGNTRLKAAPLDDGGRVGEVVAIAHDSADFGAEIARQLPGSIDVAYLASVAADDVRVTVLQALSTRCRRIAIARTARRWGGLRIAYAEPARLGVDRFLAMLAVQAGNTGPALVCGIGTALTIDLLDADGRHRGGRIAPSPTLMREALHRRATQLPVEGGHYREFADDTIDALASGCDGAALGLVERSLAGARRELGTEPALVLHGGGAPGLAGHLPSARLVPTLVLDGLAHWASFDWRG